MRKIIHCDLDAFYASVEQRDDPSLRGRPVVVAWRGPRSVVCAASYEARRFGVRSAMPALRAEKLCPQAVFVAPDFTRYREASQAVRAIFARHTELIEPLSLDEAYLDVSTAGRPATRIAEDIRAAGVAASKFLAKIASDWRKPDGLFVVRPEHALDFLAPLPVSRLPGVGKVSEQRLARHGIDTVGQLRDVPLHDMQSWFGRFGIRLHELALGIDDHPVCSERPTQSVSAEDTFEQDVSLQDTADTIRRLAERVWRGQQGCGRIARAVVLKLKTSDFRLLTRTCTSAHPPCSAEDIADLALAQRERVDLPARTRYRLVGVGLTHFVDDSSASLGQGDLFGGDTRAD